MQIISLKTLQRFHCGTRLLPAIRTEAKHIIAKVNMRRVMRVAIIF